MAAVSGFKPTLLMASCAFLAAVAAYSLSASTAQLFVPQGVRTSQVVPMGALQAHREQAQVTRVEAKAEPASPGLAAPVTQSAQVWSNSCSLHMPRFPSRTPRCSASELLPWEPLLSRRPS